MSVNLGLGNLNRAFFRQYPQLIVASLGAVVGLAVTNETFADNPALIRLSLNAIGLTSWPASAPWFAKLQELDLRSNVFSDGWPASITADKLPSLEDLYDACRCGRFIGLTRWLFGRDMRATGLTELPPGVFANFTKLKNVYDMAHGAGNAATNKLMAAPL